MPLRERYSPEGACYFGSKSPIFLAEGNLSSSSLREKYLSFRPEIIISGNNFVQNLLLSSAPLREKFHYRCRTNLNFAPQSYKKSTTSPPYDKEKAQKVWPCRKFFVLLHPQNADMAQLVEQRIRNAWVAGSSPAIGSARQVPQGSCLFCCKRRTPHQHLPQGGSISQRSRLGFSLLAAPRNSAASPEIVFKEIIFGNISREAACYFPLAGRIYFSAEPTKNLFIVGCAKK